MIKPILDPSFSPYGSVELFRKEPDAALSPIPVRSDAQVPVYRFSFSTSWDYVDGMTILVIRDGSDVKQYYLDRAVTIYPGVCFGFYPLGQNSTVAGNAAILRKEACAAYVDVSTCTPKIQQLNLFTLFRQYGRDGLFFRGEQHLPLEFVYLVKGKLQNYCDGHELVLYPNDFLIFGPNQWHMQYSGEEVQFLTIAFSWEGHDFSHLYNRVLPASTEVQRCVQALLQEYEQDSPDRDEFLSAEANLLFLQILRSPTHWAVGKKPSPASEQAHHLIIDKAMQTVSERIYGKLSVGDLAAAVNVSTSQLTSLFNNYLGTTPAKYITHIRLEESKNLLSGKKLSVGEIADRLGYASIQHYSKQFRNWFGYTPSEYARKQNK